MALRGVPQLSKLYIQYCPHGGSSEGMRTMLNSRQWIDWQSSHKNVEIVIAKKGAKHPLITATWKHGNAKTYCVRNMEASQILNRTQSIGNSLGYKARSWVERKRIHTTRPSIQGQWNPFFKFGKAPVSNIQFDPVAEKYPRPEYEVAPQKSKLYSFDASKPVPPTQSKTHRIYKSRKLLGDIYRKAQSDYESITTQHKKSGIPIEPRI